MRWLGAGAHVDAMGPVNFWVSVRQGAAIRTATVQTAFSLWPSDYGAGGSGTHGRLLGEEGT